VAATIDLGLDLFDDDSFTAFGGFHWGGITRIWRRFQLYANRRWVANVRSHILPKSGDVGSEAGWGCGDAWGDCRIAAGGGRGRCRLIAERVLSLLPQNPG
jgi:hypothetical protein